MKEAKDKAKQKEERLERLKEINKQIDESMEAWKDECVTDPMLHELRLAINKSHKTKKLDKKTAVTVNVIQKALEKLSQAELSDVRKAYLDTNNMTAKMTILARLVFGGSLANLDRKVLIMQKAVRSAELNALLHYAKHFEGKKNRSGQTLVEQMDRILNERITGRKEEDEGEDPRRSLCAGRAQSYPIRLWGGGHNLTR